jgi:NitT/TauT family transport system substrate-binding protein
MFYAQEQRPGLRVVADGYDAGPHVMEVLALPGSHISSPAGLEGKSIGTAAPQEMPAPPSAGQARPFSLETVATWSVLSSDNVPPAKVHWAPMPAGSLITALKARQVDAILATEPTIYQAESQLGAVPVLDSCTGATENLPLDGYFTTSTYASRHASVVAAFRAALEKAQAQAAMTAPLQAALTRHAGLSPQTAALVTFGEYPASLSAANLQRIVNLMVTFGALRSTLTVASMVAK